MLRAAAAAAAAAARRARAAHTTAPTPPPSTAPFTPSPALPPPPPSRPLSPPALAVWGADTDVGKTVVAAGLARVAAARGWGVLYLKPVQTGYPADDDARTVARGAGLALAAPGEHAAALVGGSANRPPPHASLLQARTLTAWRTPTSPHAAVEGEGRAVTSAAVAAATAAELAAWSAAVAAAPRPPPAAVAFVETAGGPLSPAPDGALQADAWAGLRLPALVIGSPRLGGISTTLAAVEALASRGHAPLAGVVLAGAPPWGHVAALRRALPAGTPLVALPPVPPPPPAWAGDAADPSFTAWADGAARAGLEAALDAAVGAATRAAADLARLPARAAAVTWWPFTQHEGLAADRDVLAIDGRCGEHYMALAWRRGGEGEGGVSAAASTTSTPARSTHPTPTLTPFFDACASWWTQGAHGAAGARVRGAVAAAVGRYSHVIHPRAANEPAVAAAEALIAGPGAGWAGKVFWSDDGSTAIEVGLKMAFRAAEPRIAAARAASSAQLPVTVLSVDGCYHGDTLAAMDATPPSVFNERQTPWYRGRGLALPPPTAGLGKRGWTVRVPRADGGGGYDEEAVPGGLADLFSAARAGGAVGAGYRAAIDAAIDAHEAGGAVVGAALFEPVLQGAGGMRLIDPAWQIAFADAARARSIPVVADEVFSGLWRLGAVSGCGLLGVKPDVAAYAKLLTGGLLPLAATLATDAVFAAFRGGGTAAALLHGHSYSAHAAGCGAAAAALAAYQDPTLNPALCAPASGGGACACACAAPCGRLAPLWCDAGLNAIARHPAVDRCFAVGTVLAAHLATPAGAATGYASAASAGVVAALARAGVYARPLGDAVYVMRAPTSEPQRGAALQAALLRALDG